MPAKRIYSPRPGCGRQHGAAMMVMVVILVVGAAAILVGILSSSSLQIERDKTTAEALANARNALIAYAVSDGNRPGELPCPDVNDDGMLTMNVDYIGSSCTSTIGRLPWKTLGLPELRDGNGEHLWYAVSHAFWANGSSAINSDIQGNLTVSGTSPASSIIAIVFAPGAALSGQSRSASQTASCTTTGTTVANSLCATNYLEGSNALSTSNTNFQTAVASSTFNDQMIYITHDMLFQPVETRIAREAKNCLDAYAASSNSKYPWAADDNDTTYTGNYNTFFGRISATPITTTQNIDSTSTALLNAYFNLQPALSAYGASINPTTTAALLSAAQALITAAHNLTSSSDLYSYASSADSLGDNARDLANGVGGNSVSSIQSSIDSDNNYLKNSSGYFDSNMSFTWPSTCVFNSGYWNNWQNEVFFQVSNSYRPGTCSSNCQTLTINGSGNTAAGNGTYRAAVILGRSHNATGSVTSNPPIYYLEGNNLHDSTSSSSTISRTFETYSPSDANYSSVNDLVVCMDGNNNCK
ncbi:MAG: hypothetical protein WCA64_01415 [Gallionella sp.]